MARKLYELEKIIMLDHPIREEWLQIEREVEEAEIEDFVESGAGEIVDMICNAYRTGF